MLDVVINHNQYQNNDQESCHLLPSPTLHDLLSRDPSPNQCLGPLRLYEVVSMLVDELRNTLNLGLHRLQNACQVAYLRGQAHVIVTVLKLELGDESLCLFHIV
jgi:hypothetical protein